MRGGIGLGLAAVLIFPYLAQASVIDVTVSVDKGTIAIGETATLSVYAQLKGPNASAGNGIFGWDVDLRVDDPAIIDLDPTSLDRSGWTGNASTSSSGTVVSWGLDAIYDTGEGDTELGVGGQVKLFSIDFEGLSEGTATLTVEPDATSGADFLTWGSETGGDYSNASVDVTVIPEPASLLLMCGAAVLTLLKRKRRG